MTRLFSINEADAPRVFSLVKMPSYESAITLKFPLSNFTFVAMLESQ